jgi:ribosomal protein S18 acetylase RimI-like enzyme
MVKLPLLFVSSRPVEPETCFSAKAGFTEPRAMNIRTAQARDLDACLALDPSYETDYVWQMETTRANGAVSVSFRETRLPRAMRVSGAPAREWVLEHFEAGECFLVAEEENAVRGFLDMTAEAWKQVAWVHHLTVAPDRRRQGVGSALLQAGLEWAHEHGVTTMMVETQTKNHPASAFFQKHGFAFCGYNERYYSNRDIAIFFALPLR